MSRPALRADPAMDDLRRGRQGREGVPPLARGAVRRRKVNKVICEGDSGGPLVARTPAGPRLVGITEASSSPHQAQPVLLRPLRAEGVPLPPHQGRQLPELHPGNLGPLARRWSTPTRTSGSASPRRTSWSARRGRRACGASSRSGSARTRTPRPSVRPRSTRASSPRSGDTRTRAGRLRRCRGGGDRGALRPPGSCRRGGDRARLLPRPVGPRGPAPGFLRADRDRSAGG